MSTSYAFDRNAIDSLKAKLGVTVRLTKEQERELEAESKIILQVKQIEDVVRMICPAQDALFRFVERFVGELQPIALSLFVINDDTWKLMQRKTHQQNTMLPMVTCPRFLCEPRAKSKTNPMGVKRAEGGNIKLNVNHQEECVVIEGIGGDFCGVVEGRIIRRRPEVRSILLPGGFGERERIPCYQPRNIRVKIEPSNSRCTLYPPLDKTLDYAFSESPRAFHEHGLRVDTDGNKVRLKVGAQADRFLKGNIAVLIGKSIDTLDSANVLAFHVWLNAFMQTMTVISR